MRFLQKPHSCIGVVMSVIKVVKYAIKNIVKFCKDTINFLYFLYLLLRVKAYCNPIKKVYSGRAVILANGPSLKEVIPRLTIDDIFKNVDFVVMNFFAFDDVFFIIKPKHYCFIDLIFIQDSYKKDEVYKLFTVLQERVDWDLNIYVVGHWYYEKFIKFFEFTNGFLKIIPINYFLYKGYKNLRNFFYKKSLAIPELNNVALLAIYVSINLGYSEIDLYGVDHSFFNSLCVNENNQLCDMYAHFYDISEIKPVRYANGSIPKVASHIKNMLIVFEGHDFLADYAKYANVKIINCTKNSMIDSYERKTV
jgi:hypothetical protein